MLTGIKNIVRISLFLAFLFSLTAFSASEKNAPYNIILILSDQEAYRLLPAQDYQLPARTTLAHHGVTFTNHYTAAAMCSPSRAALWTGQPPQVNGVFDQMEYNFVPTLNPGLSNIGSVLKGLGYRTAFFGKFEMDKTLLQNKSNINYSTLAKSYGFDIFNYNGDVGGTPLQGYSVDSFFVGEAIKWLRAQSTDKQNQGKPFFMVLSLLNPHDIMYGDANLPNTPLAQKAAASVIMPPPLNSLYEKNWTFTLPASLQESLKEKGMPKGLYEYQAGWTKALGMIPTERKDMWNYYYNYYLNALKDNDKTLQLFIDTINEMKLWKNTVIILTADHGEMGGAHGGLRGKGPMAYEENSHIPLIIAHPKAEQGVKNNILTSHIDMLPTLLGLTGLPENKYADIQKHFPGHDFSKFATHQSNGDLQAVRPAILFNYVGISTIDGHYLGNMLVSSFTQKPLPPLTEVDMSKRGFLSFIFDGRYKYVRYYAPDAFNTPKTLNEIFRYNDVQLFDLKSDPNEMNNLALEPEKNKSLILHMNQLLNDLLAKEVGRINGRFLPQVLQNKVKVITNRVN